MAERTEEEQTKQVVEEFLKVFSSGDIDGTMDYLTDDATWWVAGTIEGISGSKDKATFKAMLGAIAAGTKTGGIAITPREWTVQGSRAAVEADSYSEPLNDRIYQNQQHFVFTVRDGKISSVKEYLDTEHTRAVFVA